MDGTQFDQLVKRLATTRLTRLTALRGLTVGAVTALSGVGLGREEAGAKKKNRDEKEIRICNCPGTDPAQCKTQKKEKSKAKKTLRRNPCAYRGRCQSGVSGCTATVPISPPPGPQCNNNGQCSGGQVCEGGQCVACTADPQCGGGLVCLSGACQTPPPCAFVGLQVACSSNADCCTSSTGAVCEDNLCPSAGNIVCCKPDGESCETTCDCCGENFCVDDICVFVAD